MNRRWTTVLGITSLSTFIGVMLAVRWEWSFLMDDIAYLTYMPKSQRFWATFLSELQGYWADGRFYPVKYMANLLKWRYLPLNPNVFHAFNTALLIASLILAWRSLCSSETKERMTFAWLLFTVGLGLAQRPLLDVVALNSIAEGWVIFFLALGLCYFPQRKWLYRLSFLLCSLSKEPAIAVWVATSSVYFYLYVRGHPKVQRYLIEASIDLVFFLLLALIMRKAQLSGSYTAGYHLISKEHIKLLLIGITKCAIGIVPVFALALLLRRFLWKQMWIFHLVFASLYLFLVIGRGGVAGYILIPPSFAIFILATDYFMDLGEHIQIPDRQQVLFVTLFIAGLALSLVRFARYANGINESTRAFQDVLLCNRPRLVIINGKEATDLGQQLADQAHAPVKTLMYLDDKKTVAQIRSFHGDVVLFELSNYFGRYAPITLETLGIAAGGWKQIIDRRVCRMFYNSTSI